MYQQRRMSHRDHIERRHYERGWLYACAFTVCCCFCCHEACEGCLKIFCCCCDDDKERLTRLHDLCQSFRCGTCIDEMDEGQGSILDRDDDEDVYFDDEYAQVILSSLRSGNDQESSLLKNSNWFALEDNNEHSTSALASASPGGKEADRDEVNKDEDEDDTTTS